MNNKYYQTRKKKPSFTVYSFYLFLKITFKRSPRLMFFSIYYSSILRSETHINFRTQHVIMKLTGKPAKWGAQGRRGQCYNKWRLEMQKNCRIWMRMMYCSFVFLYLSNHRSKKTILKTYEIDERLKPGRAPIVVDPNIFLNKCFCFFVSWRHFSEIWKKRIF